MWVRPGFEVYWRKPGESQIGLDPRCALRLTGLSAPEQTLLERLSQAADAAELRVRGRELGVDAARVQELVDRLAEAGYLIDESAGRVHPSLQQDPDSRYWHRAALAGHERSGSRGQAVIGVRGLDSLGLKVACILADARIGTVLLHDGAAVRSSDLGGGLYRSSDVGKPRQEAALGVVRAVNPKVRTRTEPRTRPDLVVLVGASVMDPVIYRDQMRDDIWHLPVLVRDLDVMIGPLVRPGDDACLRCLDLHRQDQDSRWPAVAAQAASRPHRGVETSLAWAGATLAAHQVLAVTDGRRCELVGTSLELTAWDPVPVRRAWQPHPQCGCSPATLTAQA